VSFCMAGAVRPTKKWTWRQGWGVEEVPNEDRVFPPIASFSMMMLCSTPAGDAYTFRELDQMFREAGFGETTQRALEPSFNTLLLTRL
jgi:hypothetical protein